MEVVRAANCPSQRGVHLSPPIRRRLRRTTVKHWVKVGHKVLVGGTYKYFVLSSSLRSAPEALSFTRSVEVSKDTDFKR